MSETKVVQTEIPIVTYNALKRIAKDTKMSIRSVLKKAVEHWIEEKYDWKSDPVILSKPLEGKIKTKAETLDELIYRRKG